MKRETLFGIFSAGFVASLMLIIRSRNRRVVFVDTNFFRALLKGDFRQNMADANSDLRQSLRTPFTPWRSAFSFMEWIGLSAKSIPRSSDFDPSSIVDRNFIEPAYRHYERHYSAVSQLDRESLIALAEKQREFTRPEYLQIWDATVKSILTEGNMSEWLRFALIFDAVHKLDVPPVHHSDYWSDLVSGGFFKEDSRVRNLSKFRLAYRMWIRAKNDIIESSDSQQAKDCINETHELLAVKNWEDYLDTDLIHVASYGVEEAGKRHRAICLTCDRPEVIIMRLRIYKGLMAHVRKLYKDIADKEGWPTNYESSHNGEVHCFDCSGNLVAKIDVKQDAPPLLYFKNSHFAE